MQAAGVPAGLVPTVVSDVWIAPNRGYRSGT
jgi:hypothetical protein